MPRVDEPLAPMLDRVPMGFRFTWLFPAAVALSGCQGEGTPQVSVQVGPSLTHAFAPKSAWARYVELPGHPDQLVLIIASYEVACDTYTPPNEGEVYVQVRVQAPVGEELEPGPYAWSGDVNAVQEGKRAALPFVRLSREGRALPGGGTLRLDRVDNQLHGVVEGEFLFQDGGGGQPTTSGLRGAFQARLCHVALDTSRAKSED